MSDEVQPQSILTVNAGSSSIKFALYNVARPETAIIVGSINKIGQPESTFIVNAIDSDAVTTAKHLPDHVAAAELLIQWAQDHLRHVPLMAIGHRIVHGGPHYSASRILDAETIKNLRELIEFDPQHLPVELDLIEKFRNVLPQVTQVACFDTAFHAMMPLVARMLPIPRRYMERGIHRYGFHGLSYAYVMRELERELGAEAAKGRVIIAHMGSGVSLAAVKGGQSIDTTMGLTPSGGVPMSTRSGDLDPGVMAFLTRNEKMSFYEIDQMTNFDSGLLGVSETSGDMKTLVDHEATDPRAKEAVDLFSYQVKKAIGGLSAALGGLDILVFTGGIGQDAPKVRSRICAGLDYLGVILDTANNDTNASVISSTEARVMVRTVKTDESATIVRETATILRSPAA